MLLEVIGLAGLITNALSEFWIATPWLISLGMLAALWWFFGRRGS